MHTSTSTTECRSWFVHKYRLTVHGTACSHSKNIMPLPSVITSPRFTREAACTLKAHVPSLLKFTARAGWPTARFRHLASSCRDQMYSAGPYLGQATPHCAVKATSGWLCACTALRHRTPTCESHRPRHLCHGHSSPPPCQHGHPLPSRHTQDTPCAPQRAHTLPPPAPAAGVASSAPTSSADPVALGRGAYSLIIRGFARLERSDQASHGRARRLRRGRRDLFLLLRAADAEPLALAHDDRNLASEISQHGRRLGVGEPGLPVDREHHVVDLDAPACGLALGVEGRDDRAHHVVPSPQLSIEAVVIAHEADAKPFVLRILVDTNLAQRPRRLWRRPRPGRGRRVRALRL
mmetsp:Transcript_46656/g.122530  ORF Transcript_46656/g.122530 Transcript_46656/m.122530 type:complete len:350 (-) Transcript_46656:943-1992(-)